jgi:hypothetical protein
LASLSSALPVHPFTFFSFLLVWVLYSAD